MPIDHMKLFAVLVVSVLLSGCASKDPKPAAAATQSAQPLAESNAKPSGSNQLKQAAAQPPAPFEGAGWHSMFDGQTLAGWRATDFAGHGEVACESGLLVLNMGDPFTGVNWTNPFPTMNYEVALDAMRVMGSDFFCGLTVPVGTNFCSLIVGGWGGSLVGIRASTIWMLRRTKPANISILSKVIGTVSGSG